MMELKQDYIPVEKLTQSDYTPIRGNGHRDLDTCEIRKHFFFPQDCRTVTNNAATTQVPKDLLDMNVLLARDYENVHRGQSKSSLKMTRLFEDSYQTIASFINAPAGKNNIVLYRNATEAINSVMYSMMAEFKDGDNMVTTMMEHNSNYVPWYAMCKEILPKFGRRVELRIVNFSKESGELDLQHMASLIDSRTKLVCCTGASNFFGTKTPLKLIGELASQSGYDQPNSRRGSYFLIDGAQLVPSNAVDVQELDVDFLAFSLHKMMAPFGIGVLYAKESLLDSLPPYLYGGDMIAEGQVLPDKVGYNVLPWKYCAGTPNIMGAILSAQALRLLLDFTIDPAKPLYFATDKKIDYPVVKNSMSKVSSYLEYLTRYAMERLSIIPDLEIYGPKDASQRTALIAFNIRGKNPMAIAEELAECGVEVRAGCHCATLAHHYLGLNPPASCRLSYYIYNDIEDVEKSVDAVKQIAFTGKQSTKFSFLKHYEHKLKEIRENTMKVEARSTNSLDNVGFNLKTLIRYQKNREIKIFDSTDVNKDILQTIGHTPLVRINRLNPNPNTEIYAKYEGVNPTGSIKDRIALSMIQQAEIEGKLTKEKTIIEATSGNTGVALAMIGVVKGYDVEIVMSDAVSIERKQMMKAFGAKVTLTEGKFGTDGAIRKARELVEKYPERYFMPDQFSNEYNKIAHYRTTGEEIWKQTNGRIDYFVSSLGTSGTIMGVSKVLKEHNPKIKVVSAHPVKGHYIQGLKNMEEAIVPAIYDPAQIDITIMVETEVAYEMARQIVKKEGIFVGMSSGAAMYAASQIAMQIALGTIVVIFPDRGEKYLSTKLFNE